MNDNETQVNNVDKKKLKKLGNFIENEETAVFSEMMETNEHLEAIHEGIKMMCEKEMPEMDMSETNELLKKILEKENEPIDITVKLNLK